MAKKTAKTATAAKPEKSTKTPARPKPAAKKKVIFQLEAPAAESVLVTGSFCSWEAGSPLKKDKNGVWKTTLSLDPGAYEYLFKVDGQWWSDPACSERVTNPFGGENCILHV